MAKNFPLRVEKKRGRSRNKSDMGKEEAKAAVVC